MEDVVQAAELRGPLDGQDVERFLDDAQASLASAGIPTDRAERRVADVEATLAEDDLVADGDEGRGERPRLCVRGPEQVVGQPLCGLRADARQARERLDEARDRFDEDGG